MWTKYEPLHVVPKPIACASESKVAVLRTPKRSTSTRQELERFANEAIFKTIYYQ